MSASPFELHHERYLVSEGPLRYFRAEHVTVLLADEQLRRTTQIVQIQLRPKTGQIFAQCPYFPAKAGLVGRFDVVVGPEGTSRIGLGESGVTTSHVVKYSHPINGDAHFSQDGKVYSRVRRPSFRLDTGAGHLFEFHAFGLTSFDRIEPGGERAKRLYLPFAVLNATAAVTVVGEWVPKAKLREFAASQSDGFGPIGNLPRDRDGKPYLACLLGHPNPALDSCGLLAVNLHPIDEIPNSIPPSVILLGGWDAGPMVAQPGDNVGFLAFMYPCSNLEQFRSRLGSIDYPHAGVRAPAG